MNNWKLEHKDLWVHVTLVNNKSFWAQTTGLYDPVERKATVLFVSSYRRYLLSKIKSLRFFPTHFWDTDIGLKIHRESLDEWLVHKNYPGKNLEFIRNILLKKYKVTKKQREFQRAAPKKG